MFLCCMATSFAQFSGSGAGTESDPYLILNPIQLNQLRNFLNQGGVYFKLMANIDLTEFLEDENPDQGWQPVGNSSAAAFKGILDGNGKTVKGLWIKRTSANYVGFFGYTDGATIKDVKIVASTIEGNECVGGVSGYSQNSTISNCSFSGSVNGVSSVGGFVGSSGDYMTLSANTAIVNVTGTGNSTGGFVGRNDGGHYLNISGCVLNDGIIRGVAHVGGCCGENVNSHEDSNVISNTYIHANIFGVQNVGGLCGRSENARHTINLDNCGFVGDIVGSSYVGGLVGGINKIYDVRNDVIQKCFAIGSISATGDYSGGLIGADFGNHGYYNYYTNLSDNYHSGPVTGASYVGGLVGYKKYGETSNCYSIGSVVGSQYVGGLLGYQEESTTLKKSVAINTRVTATMGDVHRVVGYNKGAIGAIGSTDENKSYNRTIVISQGVAQDCSDDDQNGTGVSATTLKLKATYVAMGWDFTNTWDIQETECYPYMKSQTAPPVITSKVISGATTVSGKCVDGGIITLEIDGVRQQMVSSGHEFSFTVNPLQAGREVRVSAKADGKEQSYYTTEVVSFLGKGTEANPYQISTAADLTQVYRKGYYKLMNDIDLTDYINQFSPTEGWESIGRDGSETIHFDGDGHKISGLWCNSTRDNTGLFSCFANGEIKNLAVETAENKQVKGGANTGIIIGKMMNGTIENCVVSGSVADGTPVGGIVGLMDNGTISKCQANVSINTTGEKTYVGGIVGEITAGNIDQCFTQGTLTATGSESYAAGLVGKNMATVTDCYSNATITSSYNAAGIVAYNYNVVEKCYTAGNLFSSNYAAGIIGYNDGANAVVKNCVAMNNKIEVTYESQQLQQSGGYGQRIIGGIKNGAPAPEMNNYALKTMQVSVNNVAQKVYDDIMNGVGKTDVELMEETTYQELSWNFIDIWAIEEGERYPTLKNVVVDVAEFTPGDVNSDGSVSVTDASCAINYILEQVPSVFIFEAADMNNDNNISVTDVGMIINLILSGEASRSFDLSGKTNEIVNPNLFMKPVAGGYELVLENRDDIIGFQFDVQVADDATFDDVLLTDDSNHLLTYRMLDKGMYRVICYSPTNSTFTNDNDALLKIASSSDVVLSDIRLTTAALDEIFVSKMSASTTGIADVSDVISQSSELKVYTLDGRLCRVISKESGVNPLHGLKAGIYMIGNRKVILK